ncbi:MAG TPA: cyclopropane-fatty-acyl-phospholipid synthase family protein [Bacteroidia bacterium]|jgi:cyclopropane-fatty-acyl-phospholipid synthase|nr:cyclopropane-fatty-acyl-phospholipid synthase family protein [Bacteroidia bacterium]
MQSIAITYKRTWYEGLVLQFLSNMKKGRVNITMPSGEAISLGTGEGNISANITISDKRFFERCVLYGDVGFGEAYTAGYWQTDNITNVIKWFLLNVEDAPSISGSKAKTGILNILKLINRIYHNRRRNDISRAKENIAEHYDLNNDFFKLFLDPSMTYSSAYFKEEGMELQEAQMAKYENLCQSLKLKPGDHVLEIGSGWGGNAIYMAKKYGCKVTTVTISEEQYKLAKERVAKEGLTDKVEVKLTDYRTLTGQFDKIVSIEMLEAVGHEFLDVYFKKCHDLLKPKGILGFQVITSPDSRYDSLRKGVDWIQKHIFPGTLLPSVSAINTAINHTGELTLMNLKEFGLDYARTLKIWREKFNEQLNEVKKLGFDETFIRKWNYYLSYCEAAFAMRNIFVMQMVYARPNNLEI